MLLGLQNGYKVNGRESFPAFFDSQKFKIHMNKKTYMQLHQLRLNACKFFSLLVNNNFILKNDAYYSEAVIFY
ncbi:hypothetical protein CWS01_20850 [Niallia nealsonii]|uniref:Uncharacterized protein n=1 Tax=Niallia nealsonii TaxID=115979 RepID=A0A2N0YWW4_9BACI|nr:hypothetical protein CWS01_20850 [Niallia nealsonii]